MRKKIYMSFTIFAAAYLVFGAILFLMGERDYGKPDVSPGAVRSAGRSVLRDGGTGFEAFVPVQPFKPMTILVYMNGSDLESQYSAGTEDIFEMAASGFDEDFLNVVLFTGGSEVWHLEGIPDGVNTMFWLHEGELVRVADAGQASMGDPDVLAGFIRLGRQLFPAEQTGLVLWNHGGGAVVGYGADERYEHTPDLAVMKLNDIEAGLSKGLRGDVLEFLGFDTCLMATIEMAAIAGNYARYLIASEEVEPEQGWDYTFLGDISTTSGEDIGRSVIERYAEFYGDSELGDFVTMSLVDLSRMEGLVAAFEEFAEFAGDSLGGGQFRRISGARRRTRNFGSGGEDGETDMVDVREMALLMEKTLGDAGGVVKRLVKSLDEAVLMEYENGGFGLGGLSVYYPYFNKEGLAENIEIYLGGAASFPKYTDYVQKFGQELLKPRIWRGRSRGQAEQDELRFRLERAEVEEAAKIALTTWQRLDEAYGDGLHIQVGETPGVRVLEDMGVEYEEEIYRLEGRLACLYAGQDPARRTIPAVVNSQEANIIVLRGEGGGWRVLGAVPTSNGAFNTIDKKLIRLVDGDSVALRYYMAEFDHNGDVNDSREGERWHLGREFIIQGQAVIEPSSVHGPVFSRKLNIVDYHNNNHFIGID